MRDRDCCSIAAPSICSRGTVAHNCTWLEHVALNPACSCLQGHLAHEGLTAERGGHGRWRSQTALGGRTAGAALRAALPRGCSVPGGMEEQMYLLPFQTHPAKAQLGKADVRYETGSAPCLSAKKKVSTSGHDQTSPGLGLVVDTWNQ